MPKKNYRRYGKRKRFARRKGGNRLATKAFVKKQIRKDVETKWFEFATTSQTVNWSGVSTNCMNITQGPGDTERVGDKITIRGIRLNMIIALGGINANVRVMVVQFRQNTGITGVTVNPLVSQVLESTTLGTSNAPLANRRWDFTQQFNILWDKTFTLTTVNRPVMHLKTRVPIKYAKRLVSYSAGGTDGANKIFLMFVSDVNVSLPTVAYQIRFTYDDA